MSAASLGLPARPTQIGFRTRPLNRYKILRQEFWNILGCWLLQFAAIHLGGASVGCIVILEVLKAIDATFLSQSKTGWLVLGAIWTFHLASTVSTPLVWPTLLALCALTSTALTPRSLFGVGTLGRRLHRTPDSQWITGSAFALAGISILVHLTTPMTLEFTQVAFAGACLCALSSGALASIVISVAPRPRDVLRVGSLCCFICFLWQLCNTRSAYQLPLLLLAPLTGIIIFLGGSQSDGDHSHSHSHHHSYEHVKCSRITKFFLQHTTPGTVVHSILLETDSRRIAYFGWYTNLSLG